jgi:hypothetical protein
MGRALTVRLFEYYVPLSNLKLSPLSTMIYIFLCLSFPFSIHRALSSEDTRMYILPLGLSSCRPYAWKRASKRIIRDYVSTSDQHKVDSSAELTNPLIGYAGFISLSYATIVSARSAPDRGFDVTGKRK